ncbi:hypothetical protein MTO96_022081 [Rhipicephalus appendiculatus]
MPTRATTPSIHLQAQSYRRGQILRRLHRTDRQPTHQAHRTPRIYADGPPDPKDHHFAWLTLTDSTRVKLPKKAGCYGGLALSPVRSVSPTKQPRSGRAAMGPHSSGGFRWLTLLALVVVTLPAEVLPASRKKSSSSKKTTYYYYQPAEYRGHWYHQWPDTLSRRSFGSWEDTYDEWLPWKGVKYMVLIGLMLPIVLIIISVMVGTPLLVPAVPPALLPPLTAESSQGRRRRQVFGEPLEDVLVTTLEKLLVAVAKYGDL